MKLDDYQYCALMSFGAVGLVIVGVILLAIPDVEKWRACCAFPLAIVYGWITAGSAKFYMEEARKAAESAEEEGRKSP